MLRDAKGANCQASNFSRAFTATPHGSSYCLLCSFLSSGEEWGTAAALGLMDLEDSTSQISYSSLIQTFNQFLLDQMTVEADLTPNPNPLLRKDGQSGTVPSTVSQLFGMHTTTKTLCPECGAQSGRDSLKNVLDLVYPRKVRPFSFHMTIAEY